MRDTRSLFSDRCYSKNPTWDGMPAEYLDDEHIRLLMRLPRKQVAWDSSPMDDIFYKTGDKAAEKRHSALEWVVERMGEGEDQLQYFYVNNEGYGYARYTFRFNPRPV